MAARASKQKGSNKNNGKKKVSGRRGTPTRQETQTDIAGIIGIVLFCLGILLFTCNFIPSRGGFLNACRTFLRGMGGTLCLMIPIMFCFYGVVLVFFRNSMISTRRMICGLILFLLIETIFQVFSVKRIGADNYMSFLQLSYEDSSRSLQGGGLLGALLAWPLYKALDVWGAAIVLIFSGIIVLVIMTGFSFGDFGPSISEWVDDLRENRQLRREEKEALREAKEEELLNREAEEAMEKAQKKKKSEKEDFSAEMPAHFGQEKDEEENKPAAPAGPPRENVKKKKKKTGAVKAIEPNTDSPKPEPPQYPADEPITGSFRPVPGTKPKKQIPYTGMNVRQYNKDLYIEREDEFTRKPGEKDERSDNNGRGFTQEEAEYEFWNGLNSSAPGNSPYARPQGEPGRGPSLGNPIPLYPNRVKAEEDPYESYRTKNYDTGVAVGYDPNDTTAPELEDIGTQNDDLPPAGTFGVPQTTTASASSTENPAGYAPASQVKPVAASSETFQAAAPVSFSDKPIPGRPTPPAEPVVPQKPVPPVEPVMPQRPVPPVEPVMPQRPVPPVAPVPPYNLERTSEPIQGTAVGAATVPGNAAPAVQENRETGSSGKRSRRRRSGMNATQPVVTGSAAVVAAAALSAAAAAQESHPVQTVTSGTIPAAEPVRMPVMSEVRNDVSPMTTPATAPFEADAPRTDLSAKTTPAVIQTRSNLQAAGQVPAPAMTQTRSNLQAAGQVSAPAMTQTRNNGSPMVSPETATVMTETRSNLSVPESAPADARGTGLPVQPVSSAAASANAAQVDIEHREHPTGSLPSSLPPSGIKSRPQGNAASQTPNSGNSISIPFEATNVNPVRGTAPAQPVVELREGRLDGTPLVPLPRDMHDSQVQPVQKEYIRPSLDLLVQSRKEEDPDQRAKDENGMKKLLATLESFGVQARGLTYTHGPAITRYEIQPAPGVKVSRIVNLVDDIALNMASTGVRIEAPIPGKAAVGIEVPNESISMVTLRDVLDTPEMEKETSPTAVALGKGISGKPVIADMAKMPHVLIAGSTGSGKSVCINTIINSIIFRASPDEVRLILVDPKVVELSVYNGIPHLLIPVVTDPKKASAALDWAVVEMEHRYKRFESMGVRDIRGYNAAIGPNEPKMYKIIVIIDELADLMMVAPGEVEESICRLAQLARAAGIHLVIATQRPSVNVITGVIKANIPSRIAFAVSSQIDSRTILDSSGAEKLLGKGDMLYAPQGANKPTRVQGCFVSDAEVERIVSAVKSQHQAEYSDDVMDKINSAMEPEKGQKDADSSSGQESPVDEMLAKAIELAIDSGQVSISMLQRRLRIGYARAGRLVDEMTLRGITAESEGNAKPRQVLISREEWNKMKEEDGL